MAVIRPSTATNGIQAMTTATIPQTIPATANPLLRLRCAGGVELVFSGSTERRPPVETSAVHP